MRSGGRQNWPVLGRNHTSSNITVCAYSVKSAGMPIFAKKVLEHWSCAFYYKLELQSLACSICMLYNGLEWDKRVLTSLDHERQLYNTLIPLSHESPAVGLRISRLSGSVELTLRYTTPDIRCRHRRHECDGGISSSVAPSKY